VAWGYFNLGEITLAQQRYEAASHLFHESIAIFRPLGSQQGPAWARLYLSRIAFINGDLYEARRLAEESLVALEVSTNLWGQSAAHYYLGEALSGLGDYSGAHRHLYEAVAIAARIKSTIQIPRHLVGIARLLAQTGEPERAVELLAFIIQCPASWQETRDWAQRLLSELISELPPDRAVAAQERGQKLRLDDVLAEVIR
jgi:tetratricopeptide (TPR) repeat protein